MDKLSVRFGVSIITCTILFELILFACWQYSELDYKLLSIKKQNEGIKTFEMCGDILKRAEFGINGIYYADMYYCVWVKDRDNYEINGTIAHELCHHLVYENHEHFCED